MNDDAELEHLRRLAKVASDLLQTDQRFLRTRDRNDLVALWDLKHQLRRMLEKHGRSGKTAEPMPAAPPPPAVPPSAAAQRIAELERMLSALEEQLTAAIARAEYAEAERDHLMGFGVRCTKCRLTVCDSDACACECHLPRCQARNGIRQCHLRTHSTGDHAAGSTRWESTEETDHG